VTLKVRPQGQAAQYSPSITA